MSTCYDVVIKNATIIDGTGQPGFRGNIGIRAERIIALGEVSGHGAMVIDGSGLVACPGFIDPHSHADLTIFPFPLAENLVMQGITTFLGGNCGLCPAPINDPEAARQSIRAVYGVDLEVNWRTFGEWLSAVEETGISVNYAPMAGHAAVRTAVMGEDFKRQATAGEIEQMKELVEAAMQEGALGLTSFFDPSPGEYAGIDEIVELVKVAQRYGGLYSPHTRHHQNQWWTEDPNEHGYGLAHAPKGEIIVGRYHGLLEAIEISKLASNIRLLIAHFTPAYIIPQPQPEYLQEAAARATLEMVIDKARAEGVDVYYNVIANSQSISAREAITDSFCSPRLALPEWFRRLGKEGFLAQLKDSAFRNKVRELVYSGRIKFGMLHPITDPYWMDCFRILTCKNTAYEGRTIGELARQREPDHIIKAVYDEALDVVFDLLVEDPDTTWALILDKREYPGALLVFLRHPAGMPCTDVGSLPATPLSQGLRKEAPIAYGLYPHYLRTFVREKKALTLEEAIHKATGLPAQVLGLKDRGVLRTGGYADIVLLNPDTVSESGTFLEPARPPEGIECVLVNGQVVYKNKVHTGARPGKVLRRNAS